MNIKKSFSAVLAAVFLFSFVFSDFAAANTYSGLNSQEQAAFAGYERNALLGSYAKITSAADFGSETVVLNIQDFHMHPEVQRNISEIIGILEEKCSLSGVFTEGGYGNVSTEWLSNISDKEMRLSIADAMLQSGKLTGAEYYSAVNEKKNFIKGLEDKDLHITNLQRFSKIISDKPEFNKTLDTMRGDLAFMQMKHFNGGNRKLAKLIKRYGNNKISTAKYYKTLFGYRDVNGHGIIIDRSDYPNMNMLLAIDKANKSLKSDKLSKDLFETIRNLKAKMSFADYQKAVDFTDDFQNMERLALVLGNMPDDFKEKHISRDLAAFVKVTNMSAQLNPVAMLTEERLLIEKIRIALSKNPVELEVSFLSDFFAYFSDYLNSSISADDYAYFNAKYGKFAKLWDKYAYYNVMKSLKSDLETLKEYYAVNDYRNEVFFEKLSKNTALKSGNKAAVNADLMKMIDGKKIVVCVTGGYHSKGFTEILDKNKISYCVVTPNVNSGDISKTLENYEEFALRQAEIFTQTFGLGLLSQAPDAVIASEILTNIKNVLLKVPFNDENIWELVNLLNEAVAGKKELLFSYDAETKQIIANGKPFAAFSKSNNNISIELIDGYTAARPGKIQKISDRAVSKQLLVFLKILKARLSKNGTEILLPNIYPVFKNIIVFAAENNLFAGDGLIFEIAGEEYPEDTIDGIETSLIAKMPEFGQYVLRNHKLREEVSLNKAPFERFLLLAQMLCGLDVGEKKEDVFSDPAKDSAANIKNKFFIITGAPGVGKDTVSESLAKEYDIPHIPLGDILRQYCKDAEILKQKLEAGDSLTPDEHEKISIATVVAAAMKEGRLIPHQLADKIVFERISEDDCKNGFILDGYPREIASAEAFDGFSKIKGIIPSVIFINAKKDTIRKRVRKRAEDAVKRGEKPRADDNMESLEKRFKTLEDQVYPVLDYYKAKKRLSVFYLDDILNALGKDPESDAASESIAVAIIDQVNNIENGNDTSVFGDSSRMDRSVEAVLPTSSAKKAAEKIISSRIVIVGPPKSGKSTVAKRISNTLEIPYFDAKEFFEEQAFNTLSGNLLSEYKLNTIIEELKKPKYKHGFILENYPDDLNSAIFFENHFKSLDVDISFISVDSDEDTRRDRFLKANGKEDYSKSKIAFRERQEKFDENEKLIIEHYRSVNKLAEFDMAAIVEEGSTNAMDSILLTIIERIRVIEGMKSVNLAGDRRIKSINSSRIILMGAPLSGKGTLGKTIHDNTGLPHITLSSIIEDNALNLKLKNRKELSDEEKKYLSLKERTNEILRSGRNIPVDVFVELLEARFSQNDCKYGYVLDGCTESVPLAIAVIKFLKRQGTEAITIRLDIEDGTIYERFEFLMMDEGVSGRKLNVNEAELAERNMERRKTLVENMRRYKKELPAILDVLESGGSIIEFDIDHLQRNGYYYPSRDLGNAISVRVNEIIDSSKNYEENRYVQIVSLAQERAKYLPKVPQVLKRFIKMIVPEIVEAKTKSRDGQEIIKKRYPHVYGKPVVGFSAQIEKNKNLSTEPQKVAIMLSGGPASGGHNVVAGIYDAIKDANPNSKVFGVNSGPKGLYESSFSEFNDADIDEIRNTGGFFRPTTGRYPTSEEITQQQIKNLIDEGFTSLIVVGGDGSNMMSVELGELLFEAGISVVGVPKTIDGDIQNEYVEATFGFDTATKSYATMGGNVMRDAQSAAKYWHFIRLMGRNASHVTLETAMTTHPNIALVGEEIQTKNISFDMIIDEIVDAITVRAENGKNYGVVYIPEGILPFIPEMQEFISKADEVYKIMNDNNEFNGDSLEERMLEKFPQKLRDYTKTLPELLVHQILTERDANGKIQFSKIKAEEIIIQKVEEKLEKLKKEGKYAGKFQTQTHFLGYEGRSPYPSNFDANYGYSLGLTAAILALNKCTGYMAYVKNLAMQPEYWEPGGLPITMLMHMKGERPSIKQHFVEVDGPVMKAFVKQREAWKYEDAYEFPGPMQFEGTTADNITETLSLETAARQKVQGAIMKKNYSKVAAWLVNGNNAFAAAVKLASREFFASSFKPFYFAKMHSLENFKTAGFFGKVSAGIAIPAAIVAAAVLPFNIITAAALVTGVFFFNTAAHVIINFKYVKNLENEINMTSSSDEQAQRDPNHLTFHITNEMPSNPEKYGFKNTGFKAGGEIIWISKKTGRMILFSKAEDYNEIALAATAFVPSFAGKYGQEVNIDVVAVSDDASLKDITYTDTGLTVVKKSFYNEIVGMSKGGELAASEAIVNAKKAEDEAFARSFIMDFSAIEDNMLEKAFRAYKQAGNTQIALPYKYFEGKKAEQIRAILRELSVDGTRIFVTGVEVVNNADLRHFVECGFDGVIVVSHDNSIYFKDFLSFTDLKAKTVSLKEAFAADSGCVQIIDCTEFLNSIEGGERDILDRFNLFGLIGIRYAKREFNATRAVNTALEIDMKDIPDVAADFSISGWLVLDPSAGRNVDMAQRLNIANNPVIQSVIKRIENNTKPEELDLVMHEFLKTVAQKAKVKKDIYSDTVFGLVDKDLERILIRSALSGTHAEKEIIEEYGASKSSAKDAEDSVKEEVERMLLSRGAYSQTIYQLILKYADKKVKFDVYDKKLMADPRMQAHILTAA